jgi:FkbM family methyltransferase
VLAETEFEIPPGAGPGGARGWHDVLYRALDVGLGRASPTARAWLSWRLDPEVYRGFGKIVDALVRAGDTVLDLGASWGLFTYRLARRVGPRGQVLAFEPNPLLLPSLEAIAAGRPSVVIHPFALSDSTGRGSLHVPTLRRRLARPRAVHPMASLAVPRNRTDAAHDTVAVEVRRLDDVVSLAPEARVSFLKCDVEGHELAVLRGAERLLAQRPAILIEVEQRHQDTGIDAVFEHLTARGYDGYVLREGGLRPLAEFDVVRDQLVHLRPHAVFSAAPPGYLHNFLFLASGTDVSQLVA